MKLTVIPAREDSVQAMSKAINEKILAREAFSIEIKGLATRSLAQNALINVWCSEFAAWYLKCNRNEIPEGYADKVKNSFKQECYMDMGWDFLVYTEENIFRGIKKTKLKSSANYSPPEAFQFLEWVQAYAMRKYGCLLESRGQYQKLKDSQHLT